jgi:hypothetical protein
MILSEVKKQLNAVNEVVFKLENGTLIPAHFHITEVGVITKHFIDCGGTIRTEKVANFQLWSANDLDHRLSAAKLLSIIQLSEEKLGMEDLEVEVEYQSDTIGKYGLEYSGDQFVLTSRQTACLAADHCGIPAEQLNVPFTVIASQSVCTPGGGCC